MHLSEMQIRAEAHHLELIAYVETGEKKVGEPEEVVQWRADEKLPAALQEYEQVHISLAAPHFNIFLGLFHTVEVKELPSTTQRELHRWLETVEKIREDVLQANIGEGIFGGKYTGDWCREEMKKENTLYEFSYHRKSHTARLRVKYGGVVWGDVYRIPLEHLVLK